MGTSHGVSAYVDRLKGSDVRLTPQREAVLYALLERTADHPTAEEIHESARRHYPGLGLATVYRTLDLFYRGRYTPPPGGGGREIPVRTGD